LLPDYANAPVCLQLISVKKLTLKRRQAWRPATARLTSETNLHKMTFLSSYRFHKGEKQENLSSEIFKMFVS